MKDYVYCDVFDAINHTNDIRRHQVKQLDRKIRWSAFGTLLCVIGLCGYIWEQGQEIKRLNKVIDANDESMWDLKKRVSNLENKDLD